MKNILVLLTSLFIVFPALAEDDTLVMKLVIQNGKFEPAHLKVPAGKRVALEIENKGPGAEEFESHDLKREKIIPEGKTMTVTLGNLKKGKYKFFGEFHEDTAQGTITAE